MKKLFGNRSRLVCRIELASIYLLGLTVIVLQLRSIL